MEKSMPQAIYKKPAKLNIFAYVSLLTCFFFLLEFSFFIQCNHTYLSDYTFVSDHLKIPATILPGIAYFAFAQFIVHLGYAFCMWGMLEGILYLFRIQYAKQLQTVLIIWIISAIFILIANQFYLPNSKFAELTQLLLFNHTLTLTFFIIFAGLTVVSAFLALLGWGKYIYQHFKWAWLLPVVLLILLGMYQYFQYGATKQAPSSKKNLIIIGVDSLRPDYLSFFGREQQTPFFDSFLNNATVFSEAVTPLARTFPSWSGILTGLYPKEINIRFNLAPQTPSYFTNSLATLLKQQGYTTIFATDETRFSNIDTNLGFDRLITPPIGLNDFLIGTFNDFPLSNLVINSELGKWLFPYSYSNRPVYFAYDPNSFLNELKTTLNKPVTQPLFLTAHFCLPHYPYLWRDLPGNDYNPWQRYQASVARVDQQIKDFYALLEKKHLLDNAIIVLLSDHGEALELPGDRITESEAFITALAQPAKPPRFYPPSLDDESVDQSGGHGTDVLGLPQYHSLLAFRITGTAVNKPKVVAGVVSLLDIKPTLLDLLGMPNSKSSGISLASLIKTSATTIPTERHIFLESDFSPEAIRTVYPQTRQVMLEGIQIFQIDPKTTRLTVKPSMGKMIIHSKQFADIYANWMLALYPQSDTQRMPILVNLMTGEWTNDLNTRFAQNSPASLMLEKIHDFYGADLTN